MSIGLLPSDNAIQTLLKLCYHTVSERVLILRTWSLIRTFLAFWVLIGSLFIFQGPYFHYFGFIHVNCLIFAGIGSGLHCWQILIFTYAYALIFIHRRSFWVLILAAGGPYWVLISQENGSLLGPYLKAGGSLSISFGDRWKRILPKKC